MISGTDVVAEARGWLGTRWRHSQSCKGHGADCIGLVRGVARDLGLNDPFSTGEASRFAGYSPIPHPELLLEACDTYMDRLPIGKAGLGDIYVMSFVGQQPQHFAIVSRLVPRYVIHSYASARKVVETGSNVFGSEILRAYRLRGVG